MSAPDPDHLRTARDNFVEGVRLSLRAGAERGLCEVSEDNERALAALIFDQLCLHTTLQILSGMAQNPPT